MTRFRMGKGNRLGRVEWSDDIAAPSIPVAVAVVVTVVAFVDREEKDLWL